MRRIKPVTAWKIAWILPWTTLIGGIPAVVFFEQADKMWYAKQKAAYETYSRLFQAFSSVTAYIGLIAIVAELAIMLLGLALLFRTYRKPKHERSPAGMYWGMLLCCPLFMVGTQLLLVLTVLMTYGQGV